MKNKKICLALLLFLSFSVVGCSSKVEKDTQVDNSDVKVEENSNSGNSSDENKLKKNNVVILEDDISTLFFDVYDLKEEESKDYSSKIKSMHKEMSPKYKSFISNNGLTLNEDEFVQAYKTENEINLAKSLEVPYLMNSSDSVEDVKISSSISIIPKSIYDLNGSGNAKDTEYFFSKTSTELHLIFRGQNRTQDMANFKFKGSIVDKFRSSFTDDKSIDYDIVEKYIKDYADGTIEYDSSDDILIFVNDLGDYYETISAFEDSITYNLVANPKSK